MQPVSSASGRSALTAPYQNADYTRYSRGLLAYSAPNDEIWISFLLRPNVGYGVGGGLAFGTWDTGMIVGIATGTGHYGLAGTQGPTSASSTPLVQDQTVLLVSRAQVSSEGFIVWSLYVNPELEGGAPTTPDAQLEVPGTTLPQALMIYNDGGFSTDEIRVATTWASASGVGMARSAHRWSARVPRVACAASEACREGSSDPRVRNGPWSKVASGAAAKWRPAATPPPTLPPFHRTARVVAAMSASAWARTPSTQRRTWSSGVVAFAIWWAR